MSQLNELLIKLRQSAGLPEHGPLEDSPDDTASGMTNHEATPSLPSGQFPVSTETDALLEMLSGWAGTDANRWDRVLRELKKTWHPRGWIPDAPRDLLVAWAGANFRLCTAQAALKNLEGQRYLTRGQRVALRAREADISFNSRLAMGLRSWAVNGLQQDPEAHRILRRICRQDGEDRS